MNNKNTNIIIESWFGGFVASIAVETNPSDPQANQKAQAKFEAYCLENKIDAQDHAWRFA